MWQVLILLTSNHNFFNLLTIALCLFLFDDRALARVLPRSLRERGYASEVLPPRPRRSVTIAAAMAAAIIVPASLIAAVAMVPGVELPRWTLAANDWTRRYRIANSYHVFPTIETERIELQIAGSLDGQTWHPYAFRYWPGDVDRIPSFLVPHQPRLDWMMWFVPLNPIFLDWFERFLDRLLEGSPPVVTLLGKTPFGEEPPSMIRVEVYRYRFTTPGNGPRLATGGGASTWVPSIHCRSSSVLVERTPIRLPVSQLAGPGSMYMSPGCGRPGPGSHART